MKNFHLTTLISFVVLSTIPASAVALPIDFDDSTKIKLIEMGIDALTSDKSTSETSETEETHSAATTEPSTTNTAAPKLDSKAPVTGTSNSEQNELLTPKATKTTSAVPSPNTQQVHCAQVQQHCLEVSHATRSVGVYEGGMLQQTLPLNNGQAVYNVPTGGTSVTTYPQPVPYQPVQPLTYPQTQPTVYPVGSYPVAPNANPWGYGYPTAYPQSVYAPTVPVYGNPAPVFQAVPRVSSQQDVMVINVEPKAEAQTIILDNNYPVQGR
ncbi:hypothetical protein HRE53_15740 [Acaryochloris sp. 'Moss Beach']|uniref:hypothetical protein n=1 Tax=Acaryochloris sp. 'Moss Beach' TaxID=2740837 RepID=UPI001F28FC8B|nr:hypothetical protein [Acaryochloris sp. 'Moss Beach']UJB68059.1 hypothetical protein HRE53_15740 [Acaryochloris sp. 'Moss Beach']